MAESPPDVSGIEIRRLDVIIAEVLEDIRHRGQTPELPTGIDRLDAEIWGLHRAELCIIAARPGEGKTALSLQIAKHLADQGKKILFLSLEMTRHQLAERLLVQFTQFNAWNLRTGVDRDTFFKKVEPLAPVFKRMNLRLVDGCGYSIAEVTNVLNRFEESGGAPPDVLMIDFIQLIRLEGGMARFDAIGEYLRAMKELAMRHKMAVLMCSQLNREAAKGSPRLANLKGSGAIEELADCVIMCHWEELGTEEHPKGYKYTLNIEKQRHGSPGAKIPVRFKRETLTFVNIEDHMDGWHEDGRVVTKPEVPEIE